MAEILEKLAVLQSTNPPLSALVSTAGSTGPLEKTAGSEANGRVGELEKQLGDLTQRRLDYLEKMHEQQMKVQVRIEVGWIKMRVKGLLDYCYLYDYLYLYMLLLTG